MATANQGFSPPRLRNYRRRGEVPAILLLAGLFGAALLLIAYSVYTGNLRQDDQRREGEEKILAGSLVNQQRTLARTLIDYTNWNESFDRLAGTFDPVWAQSNIGATVQEILKYQLSLTVKPDGSAAYGRLDGSVDAQRAMRALGPEAMRLIEQVQDETGPPRPAVAVLSGPEGLFLAGASAILPEEGARHAPPPKARSILVFGRRLDAAWLTRIEEDFGLSGLAFVDPTTTPAAGLATVDLRGPAGTVVGRVAWQPRRSGQQQLEWLLPALAGNLLAIAIFAGVAVRGLRLARALSGSRAHLRDFVEVSSDYLWETDAAMRVTWLSASFAKRTGLRPEVLLGKRRQDLRLEDVGDDDWCAHLADLAAQRPFRDFTYSLRDGSGRQRLLQISGKPVFGPNRQFLGYRGTGRDITAEGEANRRLRESETRFRSLVENLRGIIFCRGVAGNGPYGYDEHGVQVFGPDARDLSPISATATWYAVVHPDDLPGYLEAERRRKEHASPYSLEYRIDPAGSGEERWVQEVAWVTEAPGEHKRYLDSYVIDVTDRKRAEIRLAEQGRENATYRAMIEALPDVIFAKDLDGRFLAANTPTAALTRAGSAAELIGKTDFDFFPPAVARGYRDSELAFHASGQTMLIEQTVRHPGCAPILLMALKTPLVDESGRTIGYVGHNRDITDERRREVALHEAHERLAQQADELRRLAHAAEQASRAKSEFLAAMSHEIRTPMTGVLGMADLLAAESLSPPQRRYLDTIRNSGRHLLGIINSILDFSRIEAGRMEIERIDFAPAQVLEQAQSILAPQAAERGLELRIDQAVAALLVVRGDPTRLQQVLVNLIGNGLKFTTQGSVTLTVRELPGAGDTVRLRFEVRDTGIGIPHDRQADLFEAFVQATQSTNRHYGGSGLGLAICRRLVEAMGGTIGLESELGQGSLFWFELAFEPGDARAAAQRSVTAPPRIRPLRVLVADDVAANRELVAAMLGRHGHEVLVAENGAEAVEQVAREQPDVVLMDIQMPVMDGLEATRRIRLLPEPQASVPVLALTANVMASERRRYLAAGMDQCLTKPVDWSELFAALAGIAAGDRLQPAAGGAPAPQEVVAPPPAPLLDRVMLDNMARSLPPGAFRQLLARGLDGAGQSHRQLVEALGDPAALARAAHRLRGTAGSFGLALISALAGSIEARVAEGQDVAALVDELEAAVEATRAATDALTVEA